MEWKPEYSVGDADLDRDHMSIFNAVDQVRKAQKNGFVDDYIGILLNQLLEYVDDHFAKKEEYMADISYPELPTHRDKHEKMKAALICLRNDFIDGEKSNIDELVVFLTDWWEMHILGADLAYKVFADGG